MRGLIGKILKQFWCQHKYVERSCFEYSNGYTITWYDCSKCGVEGVSYDRPQFNKDTSHE